MWINNKNLKFQLKKTWMLVTELDLLGKIIYSTSKCRKYVLRRSVSKYGGLLFLPLASLMACEVSPDRKNIQLTKIEVENPTFDLGTVSHLDTLQVAYTLKNTGCYLWRIDSIITSCECLHVENENKELPPGKSTQIVLKLYPGTFHGDFMRTAELKGNSSHDVVLTLTGTVL